MYVSSVIVYLYSVFKFRLVLVLVTKVISFLFYMFMKLFEAADNILVIS